MTLPNDFNPAPRVEIGSNLFINGQVLIALDSEPIFLIGQGAEPRLWLGIPGPNRTIRYLVEDNQPRSPRVRVLQKDEVVSIYFDEALIVQVVRKNANEVSVTHLDLTLLGLTIKGDLNSLKVGGSQLSQNTFENVEVMVNVAA